MRKTILALSLSVALSSCASVPAQVDLNHLADTLQNRWQLLPGAIQWQVTDSHQDHIEFSGEQMSAIIHYGSDEQGKLSLNRRLVWPMLRTLPNDTHASLIHDFPLSLSPQIKVGGEPLTTEQPQQIRFDGILTIRSQLTPDLSLVRTLSPSPTEPMLVEQQTLTNNSQLAIQVDITPLNYQVLTPAEQGVDGSYKILASSSLSGSHWLQPGKSLSNILTFSASQADEKPQLQPEKTLAARQAYIASLADKLQLVTPDPVINQMFEFAKLRAAESIFRTAGGLMHGPGGGRYYAAIWANDQAEYVNPFFPFLGDRNGNESALNSFRHFARYMNDAYHPIPSSIIAEGKDIWNGAGDRGDCAMIAYGAARYALALGSTETARQLSPLIDWCIDYNNTKKTADGVIASDSDELEGRFEAGEVNLSTNTLAYGALISASHMHRALGNQHKSSEYAQAAQQLRQAINSYFSARVEGFDTYRYYDGNTKLRAWIALPLTMGMTERKQGTLDALLSPLLWSENGIYTESGDTTFWDRATLYAFRGIFAAGETDIAMSYFKYYSRKRLLNDHVPYAVEAWPEGGQRHLSAESGLYARVITEGLFGIEPTGFDRFTLAPHLPSGWDNMCLNNIQAFNRQFDLCAHRDGEQTRVQLRYNGQSRDYAWLGQVPLEITL
ncbi:hypothetical protein [Bowmanella denitrificans]|uniref:hypothetical protein n=1 Tax=Bowmanella denitrificans TaxID=366582 RepID=UPI000C9AF896|nr:hypothetical protein [Bowmanella denitrificans]